LYVDELNDTFVIVTLYAEALQLQAMISGLRRDTNRWKLSSRRWSVASIWRQSTLTILKVY